MNLEQAIASAELRRKVGHYSEDYSQRKAIEVAERVFEVSAMADGPYENIKPEDWAQRWLSSQTFVLAEIAPHHVAVPHVNRIDRSKVQATLQASAEEIEPIVVDLNKQGIGATNSGYVPKVIVVDGKHRHRAQVLRGKDRVLAWVGDMAMAELQKKNNQKQFVIKAASNPFPKPSSKLDSLAQMYAAVAPMPQAMTRQDSGDGGSRPTGGTRMEGMGGGMGGGLGSGSGMNPSRKGIYSQNARSSGSISDPDPSDTKAEPDPSDVTQSTDPSDRRQWNPDKPQNNAPGSIYKPFNRLHKENDTSRFDGDPSAAQPGAGIGPRIKAGPIRVKRIVTSPKGKK